MSIFGQIDHRNAPYLVIPWLWCVIRVDSMQPHTKRINVFTNDSMEESKRPKALPVEAEFCGRHLRYCGPNHERFYIHEEKRWMHSWEEYKYVQSQDYSLDSPVYFCAIDLQHRCVTCQQYIDEHMQVWHGQYYRRAYQCRERYIRTFYNKYTHYNTGLPLIIDMNEEWNGRYTQ